jgi:SAM-dependent methyltransferase
VRRASVNSFVVAGVDTGGLALAAFASDGDHIVEGVLKSPDGRWFPILDGVPSFLTGALRPDLAEFAERYGLPEKRADKGGTAAVEQAMTRVTFSHKWRRFRKYGLEPEHEAFLFGWYCKKFGLPESRDELIAFYARRRRILEVGPGSGFNTRFIAQHCRGEVFAADVSDGAFTTFANTRDLRNCTVVQADLMDLPFADESFDLIIADGVLHHTPDARAAVNALYRKLAPGGQFFFYLYKKMGAARQFADAHIREHFVKLDPEDCYEACKALTDLGRELSKLNAKITLERPIPALGIPAGTHDVQRLVYYNFVKCFWNDAFDYDTNNMVNFDWYHPHTASQQDRDEVEQWLEALGTSNYKFNDANPNGLSVLLKKPL